MKPNISAHGSALPVLTVAKIGRPRHPGRARRCLSIASRMLPSAVSSILERTGMQLEKIANTLRFERFWKERVYADPRTFIVPTFNKTTGKRPIWNAALNWLQSEGAPGVVIELGTNNGGWLKYFADRLPPTFKLVGFDCFEGLPEAWDGLPAGSIKGFGAPVELWADDPAARDRVIADAARGISFPPPPQSNVSIESGLFSESLTRYLSQGWPQDLRLVHFDADLYISTRPMLDALCGPLKHRYLMLFDEFYSVNHEFRAWNEFVALYRPRDWRVVAASEDGSQVLIEVNSKARLA